MEPWPSLLLSVVSVPLHIWAALSVLAAERRRPAATLAWLLAVLFLPFVGVIFYVLIGRTRARRLKQRSLRSTERVARVVARFGARQRLHESFGEAPEPRTLAVLKLAESLSTTPASTGNSVDLLNGGAAAYRSMLSAIAEAKHSVHVLFYIIRADRVGESLRDRLAAKVKEGVEVRLLFDGVGSIDLPDDFWRPLTDVGGEVAVFNPVLRVAARWRRRDRVDFRNHRKIVVVDGRIGFTGGINVGREYLGLDPDMGHWRDTHVRVRGPAVLALQEVFAHDWLIATDHLAADTWFPDPPAPPVGRSTIQVVDSGPESAWSPMGQLYTQALSAARDRAWLTTPYFVPNEPVEEALINAALRGVDVRLLVPGRGDHLMVSLASRSYYRPLLRSGVRIFEYQRGFVHAKTLVIDDWLGTIGSANMDMRSFLLNFELNAFVFERRICDELASQYLLDLQHADEVLASDPGLNSYPRRLLYQSARLLSPLL
ncbi:MAG: cardiolipin synthase [Acidobacteriota bacterium]